MTQPINDRTVTVVATSAGQTVFAYDFPAFEGVHIAARYEDVSANTIQNLTNGTDFTVQGAGASSTGGTITLVGITVAVNDRVTIFGNVPIERASDYQQSGDFFAATVNREEDLQIQMLQEQRRDVDRSLKLGLGATGNAELPPASDIRNRVFAFDGNGDAAVGPTVDEIAGATQSAQALAAAVPQAEQARDDAQAARDASQSARDDSVAARNASQSARDDSQTARDASVTARDEAQTARTDAQSARDDAQTARDDAQTAQAASESARDDSIAARNASQTARDDSQTARGDSQTAQTAAEAARDAAAQSATDAAGFVGQDLFQTTATAATLTIASGTVAAPTNGAADIEINSTSGTETLNTITGGALNKFIVLRPASGDTITLTHGLTTANGFVLNGADVVLSAVTDTVVLRHNGFNWTAIGGTALLRATGGGGGVWEAIGGPSDVSGISGGVGFTGFDASIYVDYRFVYRNLLPASNAFLRIATSSDGGANYDTSGYRSDVGANNPPIISRARNHANSRINGTLEIFNPGDATSFTGMIFQSTTYRTTGDQRLAGELYRTEAAVVNAVRFDLTSGGFTSGEIQMEGRRIAT